MDHDALLASLSATISALDDPSMLDLSASDLAVVVAGLDGALTSLAALRSLLVNELTVIADAWPILLPDGRRLAYDPGTPGWQMEKAQRERLVSDARAAIVNSLALDRSTGEVNPQVRSIANEALGALLAHFSVQPRWTGMDSLVGDLDAYRQRKPGTSKIVVEAF
jgi:hypothetical protein